MASESAEETCSAKRAVRQFLFGQFLSGYIHLRHGNNSPLVGNQSMNVNEKIAPDPFLDDFLFELLSLG